MASIQGVGCRDDGTVLIDVKHAGKSIVVRMSPDAAMKVFVDLGVTIDRARDIWNTRKAEADF
jgi:hypothetical protein